MASCANLSYLKVLQTTSSNQNSRDLSPVYFGQRLIMSSKDAEWSKHKEEVSSLYRKNPLNRVMKHMIAKHGFHRKYDSLPAYRSVLTMY